jgi:hypothetical protein
VSSRIEQAAKLRRRRSSTVIRSKQASAKPVQEETLVQRAKERPRDPRRRAFLACSVQRCFGGRATTGFILPRPFFLARRSCLQWNSGPGGGRAVGGHLRWFKTQPDVDGGPSYSGFRPKNLS